MAAKRVCFKEVKDRVPNYLLLVIEKIEPYPKLAFNTLTSD